MCGEKKKISQKDGGSCVGSNWMGRGEDGEERSEWQRQDKSDTDMILNVSRYVSGTVLVLLFYFIASRTLYSQSGASRKFFVS